MSAGPGPAVMQFINKHNSKIAVEKAIIGGNIMLVAILIKIDFDGITASFC